MCAVRCGSVRGTETLCHGVNEGDVCVCARGREAAAECPVVSISFTSFPVSHPYEREQ